MFTDDVYNNVANFHQDWFTATPWNLKTNLAYELAKNPRFNIYCFDAIYPYHYTTEEITQVAGKVFDNLIPFP